jgi:hypothetical protein
VVGCGTHCPEDCSQVRGAIALAEALTPGLKACAQGFWEGCTGFEEVARTCEFEPALDAAKWKEHVQLERIAKLEARVQELELHTEK